MLKNLFSSKIRINLLSKFLMHSDEEFYLRQLAKQLHASPRSISLELQNLESIEFIIKRISGKQHYYRVNQNHTLFPELRNIFLKTIGLSYVLAKHLMYLKDKIHFVFVYGPMARDNYTLNSDVEIIVIGDIKVKQISPLIVNAGAELNRKISYSVFSFKEFLSRLEKRDHFLTSLLVEQKMFIIGKEDEFTKLVEEWFDQAKSKQSLRNRKFYKNY